MTIYRHPLARNIFYYSDLVNSMADKRGAHWLVDAIASHVKANPKFKKQCNIDLRFNDLSIWILTKNDAGGARLIAVADTMEEDLDDPVIVQEIEYTDFDFDESGEFKLYCGLREIEGNLAQYLFLPEEY